MNLNNRVGAKTTFKTEAQATKKLDIPADVTMRVTKVFREAFVCFTDISPVFLRRMLSLPLVCIHRIASVYIM
jgi:hypothetical protein